MGKHIEPREGSRAGAQCYSRNVEDAGERGAHVVVEVAIEAQDVGVAQVRLDLDLPAQLVLHLILLQLRLVQRLHRHTL